MKYRTVCSRFKYRILPFILAAALIQGPVSAYASKGETEAAEQETQIEQPSEPAPAPDPAPSQSDSGSDSSAGEDTPAASDEGGQEVTGNDEGSSSVEAGGEDTTGDNGGTGGENGSDETGTDTEGEHDPSDPDAQQGDTPLEGGEPVDPVTPVEEPEILQPEEEPDLLPEGAELADEYDGTNEELIAAQHIVSIVPQRADFRFFTIEGTPAVLKTESWIYAKKDTGSDHVGQAGRLCSVTILEEDGKWAYVETKEVRGFIPLENLAFSKEKEALLKDRGERKSALQDKIDLLDQRMRSNLFFSAGSNPLTLSSLTAQKDAAARALEELETEEKNTVQALVPWYANDAYTYMRGTSLKHVAEKKYALAAVQLSVHEQKSLTSRSVGSADQGALLYILQETGSWYYVESGDVRGYVRASDLETGKAVKEKVVKETEESFPTAQELVTPDKNHALYDTIFSVKEGTKENPVRRQILELAEKSIGCPYVWGGTDLYHGADCSGFVQALYRAFGYSIPRVAEAQSRYGTQIPVEDAQPGDLIFFARNGYVYHVAMYWGDGVTIEAYSSGRGITQVANVYARDAVWATRILD